MSIFQLNNTNIDKDKVLNDNTAKITSTDTNQTSDVKLNVNNKGKQTVMFDGPLSTVYCNALNEMYANESVIISKILNEQEDNLVKDEETKLDKDNLYAQQGDGPVDNSSTADSNTLSMYVYCCSNESLRNNDDFIKTYEDINKANKKQFKSKIICIEQKGILSNKTDLLIESAESLGFKVKFQRDISLEFIKTSLESM
jgi:hypothetical protein